MIKAIRLDRAHYAVHWALPKEGEFNDLSVVNQLGIDYANLPDELAKEEKLLEISRCFHGYVFKYTDLIVRGHLPTHNYNSDTKQFLSFFLPRGTSSDKSALSKVAHTLHLAFPQQTTTDVYDILNTLLLRCVKKYDPYYVDKVRDVVDLVKKKKKKYFTIEDISKKVKFNPTGAIRLLARKKYIKAVRGAGKKLIGYKLTCNWPPNAKFLSSGPVGFVYYTQMWFRYYLQEHIDRQMDTLEVRAWDKMLQLEHRKDEDDMGMLNQGIPQLDGGLTDAEGNSWAADMSMVKKSLDLSTITLAWVSKSPDKLFTKMTIKERHLIYLYYLQENSWKQIAETLDMSITQVQHMHEEIMTYLKSKFKVK